MSVIFLCVFFFFCLNSEIYLSSDYSQNYLLYMFFITFKACPQSRMYKVDGFKAIVHLMDFRAISGNSLILDIQFPEVLIFSLLFDLKNWKIEPP